jgi:hypothetical protein
VVVLDSDGSHLSRIISFRIGHGLPVSFAVPPGEAEELRKQLGQTVKKARRQFFTESALIIIGRVSRLAAAQ